MFIGTAYASEAAHGGESEGVQVVFDLFGMGITSQITTMWAIMLLLTVVSILATKNLKLRPTGLQNIMEKVVEDLIGFLAGILGVEKAKKYLPFLATMFLFILVSNYSGLLPGAGHTVGFAPPTNALSVTAALAMCTFFATHFYALKEHGLKYFKHFVQPYPFLLPLNIIEEFVKPLSLSLRLFGNIFGEEMVAAVLFGLAPFLLPLPAQLLSVLFGFVQAIVFTLLSAIYIGMATSEGH